MKIVTSSDFTRTSWTCSTTGLFNYTRRATPTTTGVTYTYESSTTLSGTWPGFTPDSEVPVTRNIKGFVKIARTWSMGDRVELLLPMTPRVARGFETEVPSANRKYFGYRGEEYFQPCRRPYASVLLGPLLFALPVPDVDPNTPAADAKWQYALDADTTARDAGITVKRQPMPAHWDWSLNAPVMLEAPVQAFDWQPTDFQSLPAKPGPGNAATSVGLVPYGCTKFRISMFPVTERTWKNPPLEGSVNLDSPKAGNNQ